MAGGALSDAKFIRDLLFNGFNESSDFLKEGLFGIDIAVFQDGWKRFVHNFTGI